MTPCKAEVRRPGQIVLLPPDDEGPSASAQVLYDETKLTASIEVIPVEDGRLRSVWPEKVARILLKTDKPPLRDTWTLRIEQTKP